VNLVGFEGSLVTLRSIEPDDAGQLHGVLDHRELRGRRYLEHEHTGPLGQADVRKQIDAWQEQRTGLALAVTSRRGEIVGHAVAEWEWDPLNASVAVVIDPRRWGGGLGSEALSLLIDWVFSETVATGVACWVAGWNQRGLRFAERHGFRPAGAERRTGVHDGRWFDTAVFDQLREEWEEFRAARG
jgi:RimJ/RimL family protein N-acetyltransferase